MLEKQLGDWKQKCEELVAEVEGCQKESRQHASELFKLKTTHEASLEQLEALRRENKAYQGTRIWILASQIAGDCNHGSINVCGLSLSYRGDS